MKTGIFNFLLCAIIILSSVAGCTSVEPEMTAEAKQLAKLKAKTWQIHSLVVDGIDRTSLFPGLTLTFSKEIFVATNGKAIWPASGSWSFTNDDATSLERGDGLQVTIESVSDVELTLSLFWDETTFGPGRVGSISGSYVFTFK